MSRWQIRKARRRLEKMGLDVDAVDKMVASDLERAEQLRADLAKQESPTYIRLVQELDALSYEPVSAQQRYESSLDRIREASLSEWERDDLLAQIDGIYGEVLKARPYVQVLSGLNHIQGGDFSRAQKVTLSLQLLESYDLPEAERGDIAGQVRKIYGE
jgi:hypothetical protein